MENFLSETFNKCKQLYWDRKLVQAAKYGRAYDLKKILEHKTGADAKGAALAFAAHFEYSDCVKRLLDAGADFDYMPSSFSTVAVANKLRYQDCIPKK